MSKARVSVFLVVAGIVMASMASSPAWAELLKAIEEALSEVTPADAAGWFDQCGYRVEVQYL